MATATSERHLTDEGIVDVPGLLSRWVRLADGSMAHYIPAGESGPPVGGLISRSDVHSVRRRRMVGTQKAMCGEQLCHTWPPLVRS